jgi:spermidine synthase
MEAQDLSAPAVSRGSGLVYKRLVPAALAILRQPASNFQIVKAIEQNAAVALTGLSAVVGQIVLLRELIVIFNGNEISLGIMLATWLFWTAVGSSLCSTLRLGAGSPRRTTEALECLLAVSLPATIWALRAARSVFESVPGELVGPIPMMLTTFVCLSLFCAICGALFVVGARMVESERGVTARVAASSAYLLEAAGSAFGGILSSVVLLRFLGSFEIAILIGLLNLCMAAVLALRMNRRWVTVLTCVAVLAAIPLFTLLAPRLDSFSQARLWQGFNLIGTRDTIYGKLAVTENGAVRSLYSNGVNLANAPDPNSAEEAVDYALLEHPAPQRVLLIGGGVNGSVSEALKHPSITQLDYVELDPALIAMARQFFPAQASILSDTRVRVHYADGRRFVKTAKSKFDVIIVDVPDPQTAQLNRFYTSEFFRSAREHLAPGGLLAIELRSAEETLSPDLKDFLRCIRHTLEEIFPHVVAIPDETIHFFGAAEPGVLTADPRVLIERLQDRRLNTQYVSQYFIPYRMMPDRMRQVDEQLQPLISTPVNRDFAPIAYSFDVVLWSAQFRSAYSAWFRSAAQFSFREVFGVVAIVLLIAPLLMAFVPSQERRSRLAAACCTAAAGFTVMALQILLLLGFESVYGYVYHELSILIGLCMGGLALGSWLAMRRTGHSDQSRRRAMTATQMLLAVSGPVLLFAISQLGDRPGTAAAWAAAQLFFPTLAALSGMLGGYQFAIAAQIFVPEGDGRLGLGALYAIDLLGGCAGALVLSTYLIPVFGFWKTAWLGTAINLAAALTAAWASMEKRILPGL